MDNCRFENFVHFVKICKDCNAHSLCNELVLMRSLSNPSLKSRVVIGAAFYDHDGLFNFSLWQNVFCDVACEHFLRLA